MLQALITYWIIGLAPSVEQFFTYFLTLYLICFTGMSMGLLFGSIFTDHRTLAMIDPFIGIFLSVFSGYYKNLNNIPSWISWLRYLSPVTYSLEAFIEN